MTFKEGDVVEVCRANGGGGILPSWFRARVMSADRNCYKVEYENAVHSNGKRIVEYVSAAVVRPQPPVMAETKILAVGDMVEAYDSHSWNGGKVVKILPGKFFVVELMDSLGQKTCHQSTMRPMLAWEENKWFRIHQADRDHLLQARFGSRKESRIGFRLQDLHVRMNVGNQKRGQLEAKFYPHKHYTNSGKRKRDSQMQSANEGSILKIETAPRRRRAIHGLRQQGAFAESSLPMLEKVDTFPFPRKRVGEKRLLLPSLEDRMNLPVEEAESSHSSVASNASTNLPNHNLHSDRKKSNIHVVSSPSDDAQSSCESSKVRAYEPFTEKDIAAEVHKCELQAYRKTIRAFYASGCLTWEREALLTDLRLSLHISHDEHLSELTRLCPAQAVFAGLLICQRKTCWLHCSR